MSAIAGLWHFDGRPEGEALCKRMLAAQEIYGPHDGRQWSDGVMAMGRRLFRLLPEDRFDRQPLVGADGSLVLRQTRAPFGWEARRLLRSVLRDDQSLQVRVEALGEGFPKG